MKEKLWTIGIVLFLIAGSGITSCWGCSSSFTRDKLDEGGCELCQSGEENASSNFTSSSKECQKEPLVNVKITKEKKCQFPLSSQKKSSKAKGTNEQKYFDKSGLYSFNYPQGWKVLPLKGSNEILLAPPGIDYSPQSRLEVLIVMTSTPLPPNMNIYSKSFITDLDNVIKGQDQSIKQISQPKRFTVSDMPALKVDYAGVSQTGEKVKTRVYAIEKYNNSVILVASMLESKANLYLSDLEDIFKSIRMKKPKESRLAGTYEKYESGLTCRFTFYPDGRFERESSYAGGGTFRDPTGDETGQWSAFSNGASKEGTYRILNNQLILNYNDGQIERYEIEILNGGIKLDGEIWPKED